MYNLNPPPPTSPSANPPPHSHHQHAQYNKDQIIVNPFSQLHISTPNNECSHHQDSPWLRVYHPELPPSQSVAQQIYTSATSYPASTADTDRQSVATPITSSAETSLKKLLVGYTSGQGTVNCRVRVLLDRPFFVAGQVLTGHVEIISLEDNESSIKNVLGKYPDAEQELWLGVISVSLHGEEELLTGLQIRKRKTFYSRTIALQDATHPTNAVMRSKPPDADGYWKVKKGRTVLPFSVPLDERGLMDPRSTDGRMVGSVRTRAGSIRYTVSGHVYYRDKDQQYGSIVHYRNIVLHESWQRERVQLARMQIVTAEGRKRTFLGGEGELECSARTERGLVTAGGILYARVSVRNMTKKRVQGIKLSLWRRVSNKNQVKYDRRTESLVDKRCKLVAEKVYRGIDWRLEPIEERERVLALVVPSDCASILNAPNLRVSHIIQVSVLMTLSKDLSVEMPIVITHPSSWSDVPPPNTPDGVVDDGSIQRELDAMYGNRASKEVPIELPGRGRPRAWSKTESNPSTLADIPDEGEEEEPPPLKTPSSRLVSQVNVQVQTHAPTALKEKPASAFVVPNQMLAAVTRELNTPQDNGTVKEPVSNIGNVKQLRVANPDPMDGTMHSTYKSQATHKRRSIFGSKRVKEFFRAHTNKDLPIVPVPDVEAHQQEQYRDDEQAAAHEAEVEPSTSQTTADSDTTPSIHTDAAASIRSMDVESIVTSSGAEEDEGLIEYSKFVFPEAVSSMVTPRLHEPHPPPLAESTASTQDNSGLRRRVTVMLKRLGSRKLKRRGSF